MLEALASCFVCAPLPLDTSTPQSPIAFDPRWQLFHYRGYTIGAAAPGARALGQPRRLSLPLSSPSLLPFRITEQHREFRQLALPFQPFSSSLFSSLFLLSGFGRRLKHPRSTLHTLSLPSRLLSLTPFARHSCPLFACHFYPISQKSLCIFRHHTRPSAAVLTPSPSCFIFCVGI